MKILEEASSINTSVQALGSLAPLVRRALRMASKLLLLGRSYPSYENLSLAVRLDLRDRRGYRASLERSQEVRFLAEEAGVVRDLVWGDGDTLARYRVRGAELLTVRREGLKQIVWLGLPNRPARGEHALVRSSRTILNGFMRSQEYLETEVERPTRRVKLTVTFPPSRPPKEGRLVVSPPFQPARRVPARIGADGRPYLEWRQVDPKPSTKYRLTWSW